jgi:hypothetical protein
VLAPRNISYYPLAILCRAGPMGCWISRALPLDCSCCLSSRCSDERKSEHPSSGTAERIPATRRAMASVVTRAAYRHPTSPHPSPAHATIEHAHTPNPEHEAPRHSPAPLPRSPPIFFYSAWCHLASCHLLSELLEALGHSSFGLTCFRGEDRRIVKLLQS